MKEFLKSCGLELALLIAVVFLAGILTLSGCAGVPINVEVCIMHPTYGKICGTLKGGEVTLTADVELPHDVEARIKEQIKDLARR